MQKGLLTLLALLATLASKSAGAAPEAEEAAAEAKSGVADAAPKTGERPGSLKVPDFLPLDVTAFGDIQYRFERDMADEFRIGSLELDAALTLAPYAIAATAIGYDADSNGMALASFVVDGGLFGEGEHHLWQSKLVQRSGLIIGRFDVPVGIAYLEYPSVAGRFADLPRSVEATHGAWNDLGIQFYSTAEYFNFIGYFVNGEAYKTVLGDGSMQMDDSRFAYGGRLGLKPIPELEIGASIARALHEPDHHKLLYGVDLAATAGKLDVRSEYLATTSSQTGHPTRAHGGYARGVYGLDPAFLMARYDVVLDGPTIQQRTLDAGAGVQVFPGGEIRGVFTRGFDDETWLMCVQVVGGSTFQPTGLRHLSDE